MDRRATLVWLGCRDRHFVVERLRQGNNQQEQTGTQYGLIYIYMSGYRI